MPSVFNYRKSINEGGILSSGFNAETYVKTQDDSAVREWKNPEGLEKDSAEVFDPVEAMKEGVPVLRWDTSLKSFEWRVLKTDERLNFLYVLTDNLEIRPGSMKDLRSANIQTIKVDSILQVLDGDTALSVFTELDVMDKYLSAKSANLIKFGQPNVPYSMENTVFFMAAPRQHLKKCIEATISHAPDTRDEMEDAVRKVQHSFRIKPLLASMKATAGNILSIVRLKDPDVLFDPGLTSLVFELVFQSSVKKPVVEVTLDADAENPVDLATKEAATHKLNITDTARFIFTVEECFAQRRWLKESSFVRKGVFPFLLDPHRTATALAKDDTLTILKEEIDSLTRKHQGDFSGATARSHFQALAQFCDLEMAYTDLCDQVNVDGRRLSLDELLDPVESEKSRETDDGPADPASGDDAIEQNAGLSTPGKTGFQAHAGPAKNAVLDQTVEETQGEETLRRKEIGEQARLLKKEADEDDKQNPCPCSGRRSDPCSGGNCISQ